MSIRNIIHFRGGLIKIVWQTHGRGLVNVISFFHRPFYHGMWKQKMGERFLSTKQILKNDQMWAGEEWESISGRQSDLDKAQGSEGRGGQETLKPILA